jgi:predicted transcriptional regulator
MLSDSFITIFAIIAGVLTVAGPMFFQIREQGRSISKLDDERKLLTDHKEATIEKLTRAEEKLRALAERFQEVELIRDDQFTRLSKKIDDEIHGQARTREIHGNMIEAAIAKMDVRVVDITKTAISLAERVAAMEAELGYMRRIAMAIEQKAAS